MFIIIKGTNTATTTRALATATYCITGSQNSNHPKFDESEREREGERQIPNIKLRHKKPGIGVRQTYDSLIEVAYQWQQKSITTVTARTTTIKHSLFTQPSVTDSRHKYRLRNERKAFSFYVSFRISA